MRRGEGIRPTRAAVIGDEKGTARRPIVTVDASAGEVGGIFVIPTVVVGVPLGNQLPLFDLRIHSGKCAM